MFVQICQFKFFNQNNLTEKTNKKMENSIFVDSNNKVGK